MKKILTVFSIAMCMITVFPAAVYADETEELFLTDAGQGEELIMDEAVPASEDIGEITAIDAPGKKEYTFEFKSALADVVEELPKTLTVHSGDDTASIDVKWICEKDYNDTLGEYPFIPDMTGYT
ncbi:MAG: hypothetical protein IKQ40_01335, partial [Lachnospiraceae bacterium]|nr:hypothetical protein [Lachnospiraceae bacterium]